jgi:hypothetical protein
MSQSVISGYEGQAGAFDVIEGNGMEFIKVYNDLGSAISNGAVYAVEYLDDADSKSPSAFPTLVLASTQSAALLKIGVVNNTPLGKATIADQAWGYVQTKGYCETVLADGVGVTDEHYIEVLNGVAVATDDGTSRTIKSFGLAKASAAAGATFAAVLFGDLVDVDAA